MDTLDKEKNFVSAVVYLYDCEALALPFLAKLGTVLSQNFDKYEVILVNDGCIDGTIKLIRENIKELGGEADSVVNMSFHQGIEAAMTAGVDAAIGDFIFEFDSTVMDYDPSLIMQVYHRCLAGYDTVAAAPRQAVTFSSRLFYWLFRKYSHNRLKLTTERFRILSRRAINRINILSASIPYRKAVYYSCGLRTDSIQYEPDRNAPSVRTDNDSRERRALAVDSLLLFTGVGTRLAMYMAGTMSVLMIGMGIYSLYFYLMLKKAVEGWTTIMLLMSGGFFGLFLLLAVIIKYVSLILRTRQEKQNYIFESIEKLN